MGRLPQTGWKARSPVSVARDASPFKSPQYLPNRSSSSRAFLLALVFAFSTACAHGPWHEQLGALSTRLATAPDDTQTRLARARLFALHGDGLAARWDIHLASRWGAAASLAALARADLAVTEEDWGAAAAEIPRFRDDLRNNLEALRLCAKIHAARGEKAEHLADLRAIVESPTRPEPDDYLALAQALAGEGRVDEALAGLEAGVARIGPAVGLFEAGIALEEQRSNWDRAIQRIDAATRHVPNSARWLARKADCEEKAGRAENAATTRRVALGLLDALPEARRSARANSELAAILRGKLGENAGK